MEKPWDEQFETLMRRALRLMPADQELLPDANSFLLGLDSLAAVDLLVNIELTYDIEIPEDHLTLQTFATPAILWTAVQQVRDAVPNATIYHAR